MENKLIKRGGTRPGSGPKQKYNEQTVTISFRVPVSKADDIKNQVDAILLKLQKQPKQIKISDIDNHLLSERKYTVKKLRGRSHICRTVESSRGKFNVLLAQDIIGINCQILFVDGNTLNNERENLKPVNREVEFLY